jgi:hypothetical protein
MPSTVRSSSRLSHKRFDVSTNAEQLRSDRRFESIMLPLPTSQLNQMQSRTSPVDYSTTRLPLSPTSPTSSTGATKRQSSSSSALARKRRRMESNASSAPCSIEGSTSLVDDELEDDHDRAPIVIRVRVPPSSQASRRNRMSNSHSSPSCYTSSSPSFSPMPSLMSSPSSKSSSLGSVSELESSLP